jgi:hypothetical protein
MLRITYTPSIYKVGSDNYVQSDAINDEFQITIYN